MLPEAWTSLSGQLRRQVVALYRRGIAVDDVIQETLLRAMQTFGVEPVRPRAVLWSWCLTTSRHLLADAMRARRREQAALGQRGLRLGEAVAVEAWSAEVVAGMRARARSTQLAVMDLLVQGESSAAIAARLRFSQRGVELCRQRLRRLARTVSESLGGPRLRCRRGRAWGETG